MNVMRWIGLLVAVTSILNACESGLAAGKKYLTYETFKALAALCPEVKAPRLEGLSPKGQDLWSQGQMRIPAETHLFEGDFNLDGRSESALVITDGSNNYVLIAEQSGITWHRTGFVPIARQLIKGWNGRALSLGEKSFVAWDGAKYRLERGPLAMYCYGYDSAQFTGVMIKLTYIGPQDEPYPGLFISSFYRWPDLFEFKSHRTSGVFYGNDDLPAMWHLTVSPQEAQEFALTLSRSSFLAAAEDRKGTQGAFSHSLSMLDGSSSQRPNHFEVFLMGKETVGLLEAFARQIESRNADGAKLLREYEKMFAG